FGHWIIALSGHGLVSLATATRIYRDTNLCAPLCDLGQVPLGVIDREDVVTSVIHANHQLRLLQRVARHHKAIVGLVTGTIGGVILCGGGVFGNKPHAIQPAIGRDLPALAYIPAKHRMRELKLHNIAIVHHCTGNYLTTLDPSLQDLLWRTD